MKPMFEDASDFIELINMTTFLVLAATFFLGICRRTIMMLMTKILENLLFTEYKASCNYVSENSETFIDSLY